MVSTSMDKELAFLIESSCSSWSNFKARVDILGGPFLRQSVVMLDRVRRCFARCGWKLDSRARCVDATDMRCSPSINDSGASMHHTFLRVDECDESLAVDSAPDIFACKKDDLGKTPCVSNVETHGEIASQNS